jgi:hypothetical protein
VPLGGRGLQWCGARVKAGVFEAPPHAGERRRACARAGLPSSPHPPSTPHSPHSPALALPAADALVQRLIEDPNAFLRTTQTLGAESAAVTDLTTQKLHNALGSGVNLHAVLWPTLAGAAGLSGALGYTLRRWRRRRRARLRGGGGGGGGDGIGLGANLALGLGAPSGGSWWARRRRGAADAVGAPRRGRFGLGRGPRLQAPSPGLSTVELVFADLADGPGGCGGIDVDVERSPREDSFAAILRQKQQQLLSGARVGPGCGGARGRPGGSSGSDADAEVDIAPRGDGAAESDASLAGPPSELADSAEELSSRPARQA